MHAYASDGSDRLLVPPALALAAVATTFLLEGFLAATGLRPAVWLDTPAVMGFYGLLHGAYNGTLWRLTLGPLRLSSTPYLVGTWVGTADTSHPTDAAPLVVVTISQSWTRLLVRLEAENSVSSSIMAAIQGNEGSHPTLRYEFLNLPREGTAPTTLHAHRGAVTLHLSPDGQELDGDYYTSRDRNNVGTLRLRRVSEHRLSRTTALQKHAGAAKA